MSKIMVPTAQLLSRRSLIVGLPAIIAYDRLMKLSVPKRRRFLYVVADPMWSLLRQDFPEPILWGVEDTRPHTMAEIVGPRMWVRLTMAEATEWMAKGERT